MNFSALHLLKCDRRWSKPVTGFQQFCQLGISKVGALSVLQVWRQAVVYRRRKTANFLWAEERGGCLLQLWVSKNELCVTCVDMPVHVPGHQSKKIAFWVHTNAWFGFTFSLRRLIKIDQNSAFTFVILQGKRTATLRNFTLDLIFSKHF